MDIDNFEYDRSTLAKGKVMLYCCLLMSGVHFYHRCTRIHSRGVTKLGPGTSWGIQDVMLCPLMFSCVQKQVYSISPVSVQRVLSSMLESISNTLYHRLSEVGEFADNTAVNVSTFTNILFIHENHLKFIEKPMKR